MLTRFFAALYRFFAPRRLLLFAVTAALVAAAAVACRGVRLQENIAAMLPDDQSAAAVDFQLLQQAPFARKVVINLRADSGVDPATLAGAGDRFAAALPGAGIERVVSGPAELGDGRLLFWLADALPALATPADLQRLAAELTPAEVAGRLRQGYERLLSPEGWGMQPLLRADPLELRRLALEKLRHVNLIPGARIEQNHFVSADGRNLLLVADTPIVITDSDGARQIEERFDAAAATLPPGVTASYVSGHRYTRANAEAIKSDLALILSLSSLAVLAIYLIFLRSRWALFVFLVPATVLLLASGVLSLAADQVFAITLGFGGVLLGIADEYAMNVYFACRRCQGDPAPLLGEVSRPVLFSGLTTLATFAVMLLSALPGQRQLAVYAMSGIAASLLISLVVLPHLVPAAPAARRTAPARPGRRRLPRAWVLGGWLLLLLGCTTQIGKLRFDGDLRSMNLVPAELRAAERDLQQTWGNLRGQAIAFVEGRDLETALAGNERLFARLSASLPPGEVVSLAPLLPSSATQRENRERWVAFWQGKTGASILRELEAEGRRLGFAPGAFDAFRQKLAVPVADSGVEELRAAGLGEVVDAMLVREAGRVRVLTLLPDTAGTAALFAAASRLPPGTRLVSQRHFGELIGDAIGRDFRRYLLLTSLVVTVVVVLVFRQWRKIVLTLVPVLTGMVVMTGAMAWLGLPFNLFNIVATVLTIGLCVDYGIYMVCKLTEGSDYAADRAVLVSGLTTLAGFGILVLARHPALHSIGVSVLLGVGAAIPAALLVLPALLPQEEP